MRSPARPLQVLITAGPTREYIDPVRYLSNESSGKMGFAIAEQAESRGHRVTLICGPVALPVPQRVRDIPVVSAAEMLAACRAEWPRHDILIMAAAVADYRPARFARKKIKKQSAALTLALTPTVDILAELSIGRRNGQRVIGFALEDRNEHRAALSKLERKRLDAIVLNRPAALGADRSEVEIILAATRESIHVAGRKSIIAGRIVRIAESLFREPRA